MRAIIVSILILFSMGSAAQSVTRDAVTSGGAVYDTGNVQLSVSYGQLGVAVYVNNEQLSLGFQQGDDVCLGDFNNDGTVNTQDLLILLSQFGCSSDCQADLNGDDVVNTLDLLVFLAFFGLDCP